MEYTQTRLFLMRPLTLGSNTFPVWSLLGDMLTQGETGYANALRRYLEETSLKKSTITTTLLGESAILVEISGSSEKDLLLPFLAKEALLEDLWEISQSYSEGVGGERIQGGIIFHHPRRRTCNGKSSSKGKARQTGQCGPTRTY